MTRPLRDVLCTRPVPMAFHVTLALEGRRLLAEGPAGRRLLARIVYEHLDGRGLVSFGAADDHLHLLVARDRLACGALVRSLATAIHKRLKHAVAFEPSRFRAVEDARHLRNVHFYGFRQEQRHGTSLDPLLDATSLPDRIGARVLLTRAREPLARVLARRPVLAAVAGPARDPATARRVARDSSRASDDAEAARGARGCAPSGPRVHPLGAATARLAAHLLPRVHVDELRDLVGGAALMAAPRDLDRLEDAAAAAVGLATLDGSDPATVLARRAAVQLAASELSLTEIARALRTPLRTVQRDSRSPTLPPVRRAVELQLRMRAVHTRKRIDLASGDD